MRHEKHRLLVLTAFSALIAGCGAKWSVTDQRFFKYQNKDVRVAGRIEMTEEAKQIVHGEKGVNVETRLYTDNYETVVHETQERFGKTLEENEMKGKKEIFKFEITAVRLGGTENSYPKLCAEIRVEDSNVSDWTRVGCVLAGDTPSESPTGGIGQEPDATPSSTP